MSETNELTTATLVTPLTPSTVEPVAPSQPAPTSTASRLVNVNTTNTNSVGVFTTTQSLVTFPGAVAAVTTIWHVLSRVEPNWGHKALVPIGLSILLGLLIYAQSAMEGNWRERIIGFVIALINSFTIAAAALGINPAPGS